jgi:hypothetical protein
VTAIVIILNSYPPPTPPPLQICTVVTQALMYIFRYSLWARQLVDSSYRWGDGGVPQWRPCIAFQMSQSPCHRASQLPSQKHFPMDSMLSHTHPICCRFLDFILGYFIFAFLFVFSFLQVFDWVQGALLFNFKFARALQVDIMFGGAGGGRGGACQWGMQLVFMCHSPQPSRGASC